MSRVARAAWCPPSGGRSLASWRLRAAVGASLAASLALAGCGSQGSASHGTVVQAAAQARAVLRRDVARVYGDVAHHHRQAAAQALMVLRSDVYSFESEGALGRRAGNVVLAAAADVQTKLYLLSARAKPAEPPKDTSASPTTTVPPAPTPGPATKPSKPGRHGHHGQGQENGQKGKGDGQGGG